MSFRQRRFSERSEMSVETTEVLSEFGHTWTIEPKMLGLWSMNEDYSLSSPIFSDSITNTQWCLTWYPYKNNKNMIVYSINRPWNQNVIILNKTLHCFNAVNSQTTKIKCDNDDTFWIIGQGESFNRTVKLSDLKFDKTHPIVFRIQCTIIAITCISGFFLFLSFLIIFIVFIFFFCMGKHKYVPKNRTQKKEKAQSSKNKCCKQENKI